MSQIIGYARVSTLEQSTAIQVEQLKALGCSKVFEENASGKSTESREQLSALIEYAREGDTVIVMKLDRLARNTVDALQTIDALTSKNVGIKIMDIGDGTDLTTDTGRMLFTVLSAVAEMERNRILERCNEGRAKAKAEGVHLGRKVSIDHDKVIGLKAQGMGASAIARELGIARNSVYRILKDSSSFELKQEQDG